MRLDIATLNEISERAAFEARKEKSRYSLYKDALKDLEFAALKVLRELKRRERLAREKAAKEAL